MVYNLVKVKQNASRHHSKSNPSYEQRKTLHLPHKHEIPPRHNVHQTQAINHNSVVRHRYYIEIILIGYGSIPYRPTIQSCRGQ